jgi:lipopolysaccharide export system permease protein
MNYRPKRVDQLILAEVVPLFLVMLVVFTVIILVVASADLFNYLAQGATLFVLLKLIVYNILPWLVPTFPMAMLLSTTIGFVRLSTQSELVALFAAGIPFKRLMAPIVIFSITATLVALFINDTISPFAYRAFDQLKTNITSAVGSTRKPIDLPAYRDDQGRLIALIHVEKGYDVVDASLRDIYITVVDPVSGSVQYSIHAPVAKWTGGHNYTLENAYSLSSSGMYSPMQTLTIHYVPDPRSIKLLTTPTDELNIRQLAAVIADPKSSGVDRSKVPEYEVSLWERFSLPFACFAFAIIGAPLGLRPQRSAALGVAIAVGLAIIFSYYALYEYMDILGSTGAGNPAILAFFPDLLALAVGIGLLRRSSY